MNKETEKNITDIKNLKIDIAMSKEDRIKEFLKQTRDPYCLKVGRIIVEMAYSSNGVTMRQRVKDISGSMK